MTSAFEDRFEDTALPQLENHLWETLKFTPRDGAQREISGEVFIGTDEHTPHGHSETRNRVLTITTRYHVTLGFTDPRKGSYVQIADDAFVKKYRFEKVTEVGGGMITAQFIHDELTDHGHSGSYDL